MRVIVLEEHVGTHTEITIFASLEAMIEWYEGRVYCGTKEGGDCGNIWEYSETGLPETIIATWQ